MLDDEEDGALLLDEPAPEGELPEAAPDGGVLEPLAALPPLLAGGVPEALELEDEPPAAGAAGEALDDEDEPGVTEPEAEPEAEPEGAVEEEPDGGVVAPEDEDEPDLAPVLPASRSQAVSKLAPSARDTAVAIMESLMRPPWLGYHPPQQGSGQHG